MSEIEKQKLFIEINDENIIFLAGFYNSEIKFEIKDKLILNFPGIKDGKIINLEESTTKLKEGLDAIENKTNNIFKDIILIIDNKKLECLRATGFKKFNGSQILKEDISYILNDIKRLILENEKDKSIIQIFNTKFTLDSNETQNLPIGLCGDFYKHELSFFLIKNNDLNNIKNLFSKCNLSIDKIYTKGFLKGVNYINLKQENENLCIVNIQKNSSNILIFYKSSYVYFENFDFGSEIIFQDISKVCSLSKEKIFDIIKDMNQNNNYDEEAVVKKEFFKSSTYRKIRISLIKEIIEARINELISLIFKKNINLNKHSLDNHQLLFEIDDQLLFQILKNNIQSFLPNNNRLHFFQKNQNEQFTTTETSTEIYLKGWQKEAVPVISRKKSLISRFFSFLFEE